MNLYTLSGTDDYKKLKSPIFAVLNTGAVNSLGSNNPP
jgi:hypothetical protein